VKLWDEQAIGMHERAALRARVDLAYEAAFFLAGLSVDPAQRTVIGPDGLSERVEPRVMQVLVALVRANGKPLSRDDLAESCWGGLNVGDDAISRVVVRVRRLGEGMANGRFTVETLPRVGYRLLVDERPDADAQAAGAPKVGSSRSRVIPLALVFAVLVIGGWALNRFVVIRQPASTMTVRLGGYRAISPGIPREMIEALRDETLAAFNDGAQVAIVSRPQAGRSGYVLSGTVRRIGDSLRMFASLQDERSGAVLWSKTTNYNPADRVHAPRWQATDTAVIVRCGLSGIRGYPGTLAESAAALYVQYCAALSAGELTRALDLARRVTSAAPRFADGWSAVGTIADALSQQPDGPERDALRKEAGIAADRAIALDPQASAAWVTKSWLTSPDQLGRRERLYLRALRARPLDCGCEHSYYGDLLVEAGRMKDAIAQYRRAIDMLPYDVSPHARLARALLMTAQIDEARAEIAIVEDLSRRTRRPARALVFNAPLTGDYDTALRALADPGFKVPDADRAALRQAFEALQSRDPQAMREAIGPMVALARSSPPAQATAAITLGALGASREALQVAGMMRGEELYFAHMTLFSPTLKQARSLPEFERLADRTGLIRYWHESRTRPDLCTARNAPAFCNSI